MSDAGSERPTEQDLAELDRLAAAATPMPWETFRYEDAENGFTLRIDVSRAMAAVSDGITTPSKGHTCGLVYPGILHETDAAYIVAAANAVPGLVAEVRRLRNVIRTVEHLAGGWWENPDDALTYISAEVRGALAREEKDEEDV